ncbi:MAG: hypothetical protein OEX18_02560 [Candidatus Krumholzibacteria bacterium]|nr:hypothetical protein [Candidatus Krumholzibacteria bacterium]MDH4336141.1 hypothetical protein [Candidatus Krumholzibacteria bacterium]MDH5268782.1 hypothetical protein [Candidatus Krumholzibacteria bacterium]
MTGHGNLRAHRAANFATALLLLIAAAPAAWAQSAAGSEDDDITLEQKVEVLTEEVSRLREQMNIPETDRELTGAYGMGPAASKVYGVSHGISFGGYGEFYFAAPVSNAEQTGAVNTADFLRLIAYVGYKFSDRIVMNAEIEYEHATTGANYDDESGEVSVEFAYLDFLIDPAFNIRTGNLLVPMGFLNNMHEPTTYPGTFRPLTERTIIPTTWREMGAGAHGAGGGFSYSAYALNGLNATEFDARGVRSGRQKGNQAIWEDVGAVSGVDYAHRATGWTASVGGSAYYGGADQGLVSDSTGAAIDVTNQVYEAHAEFRRGGLSARALVATSRIDNTEALSRALYTDPGGTLTSQVPGEQLGWYVEAGFDIAPLLANHASFTLKPWLRYERVNLQQAVTAGTGLAADPALDGTLLTVGVESKPHPNVVLKLDFVFPANESSAPVSDEVRLGAGFIY